MDINDFYYKYYFNEYELGHAPAWFNSIEHENAADKVDHKKNWKNREQLKHIINISRRFLLKIIEEWWN